MEKNKKTKIKIRKSGLISLATLYFLNGKSTFLLMMICALGHEAGHLIFMNIFGVKIDEITVGFLNFNIKYNKSNTSYKADLFISLGGVAVNLLLFFCGYLFGNAELCFTNLILIIVNLLPIPSLDGANVISALMGCKSKKEEKGYRRLYKRLYGVSAVFLISVICDFNLSMVFTGVSALITEETTFDLL